MNKSELKNQGSERVGLSLIEFGAAIGGLIAAIVAGKFINNPEQFLIIPISIASLAGLFIFMKLKFIPLSDAENKSIQGEVIREDNKVYITLLLMIFILKKISFKVTRNIIFLVFIFTIIILAIQVSVYLSILGVSIIAFFIGVGFTVVNIYLSKSISTKVACIFIIIIFMQKEDVKFSNISIEERI